MKRKRQKDIECSVEGCEATSMSKDMCQKHIMALRRYGNVDGKELVTIKCRTCGTHKKVLRDSTNYCSEACYLADEEVKRRKREAVRRFRERKAKEDASLR